MPDCRCLGCTHTQTHKRAHTLTFLSRWNVHKPSRERPHKAALCAGSQWCGGRRHAHRRPPRSPRHRGKHRLYTHRIFLHNGMLNLSETANGDPKQQHGLATASQGTARELTHDDECRARSAADDGIGAHSSAMYRQTQLSKCQKTSNGAKKLRSPFRRLLARSR